MSPQLDNLLAINVSPSQLERLQKEFRTVHHFPDSKTPIPKDVLDSTDMYFTTTGGFPASVKSMDDMPNVKHIQLASAGCGSVYEKPMFKKYLEDGNKNGITLGTASGTHVLSIPNYVVGCVIMLYHQLPAQVNIAKVCLVLRPSFPLLPPLSMFNPIWIRLIGVSFHFICRTKRGGVKATNTIILEMVIMPARHLGKLPGCWAMAHWVARVRDYSMPME